MKKDHTRYLVLKVNVNEDEHARIIRNCAAVGKTVSAAGRELFLQMSQPAHRRPRVRPREGPKSGLAIVFPRRRGGAPIPMRV